MVAALLVAALAAPLALAQPGDGPAIYPDLTGGELATALAAAYAPTSTYGYDRARDTLFAAVHLERAGVTGAGADSLRGLYSGHAVWLDPALDPTSAAWASSPRVSTEHVWPVSRGAAEGTPAHADMHHLAPVMQSVNSSRSDHPFGEVEDADADRWWGPDGATRTAPPPLAARDLYTEKRNGSSPLLEPREDRAGDVARAVFYAWTVYGPSGSDQLDAAFWATQRDALLGWHAQDPPDNAERARTRAVERHQGTPNPFVLDATLAVRAFGPPAPAVVLSSFTAEQTGAASARVAWTTSAETGTAAFRIDGRPDVFGGDWTAWVTTTASGRPGRYAVEVAGRADGGPLAVGDWRVRLTAIDAGGTETALGDVGLTLQAVTDTQHDAVARPLTLAAPAPNPAASSTTATLTLARPARVLAVVYDALGREVAVAFDRLAVGRVDVRVDTTALAPGVYVLRAVATDGSAAETQQFTVTR